MIKYYSALKKKKKKDREGEEVDNWYNNNTGESRNHYAKWKKPDAKESIMYDLIYTKFQKM